MLFLQLSVHSSCDRVEWYVLHTMRRPFSPLVEWFRILLLDVSGCPVSPVYILHHLSFLCTWGNCGIRHPLLCMWWWQMILFTRVYPLLEALGPVPQWGRYHHLLHEINDLTSPVGRELITDMSHLVVRTSCALLLNWSAMKSREVKGVSTLCLSEGPDTSVNVIYA